MRSPPVMWLGAFVLMACGGGATPTESPDATTTFPDSGEDAPSDATARSGGDSTAPVDAGPPPGMPIDAGPTMPGTITIDPTTTVGAIPASFVGLSYEKSELTSGLFAGADAPLIAMMQLLGPGLLRIGGNSVDRSQWYTAPASDAAVDGTITRADVDGVAALAKAAGWKVLYGVDMKLSNPATAAAEATYVVGSLGSALYGFEIGNEVDLYTSTAEAPTWSLTTFETQWNDFATAMLAGTSATTPLTGPASAAHYGTWTVPFASADGSKIRLLTQHYYRGNGQSATSTVAALLTPDPALDTELDALATAAKGANIADGYRLSECNSYYNGGAPNVSDAYGTALWVLDFLFQNAEHGSRGINLHGGGNGPGYTPIADSNGAVVGARPEFYGVLLFALAGQGAVYKMTVTVTDNLNVSAYAVGAADGSTNVVVVSKDASHGIHATIDVGRSATSAGVTYLLGPALDATTGVTLGGATIEPSGAFSPSGAIPLVVSATHVTVDVPAASAALVHVE